MSVICAVLGPTNTGKTHYALERMLAHSTGMIGLPLRLLAREIYDRIVSEKGERAAALITGEEVIWPKSARYFACTIESMPTHQPVECLAIDEIQLATDPDRGHIFTDRILYARGSQETIFLGALSMKHVLKSLLPERLKFIERARFSELSYTGPAKISKLPKRSAIIAFSAEAIYTIAEFVRREFGGAAVIMGALSPRTRNSQVALYQSGEVDYLIASDAIGMGLNLDVDHIAFAASKKFDGRRYRPLYPEEIGQIAGRAGRFRNVGSFGETGQCEPFTPPLISQIETHRFDTISILQWRESRLDFSHIHALQTSLAQPNSNPTLRRTGEILDEWTLGQMVEGIASRARANNPAAVKRLWALCQLPDFRKLGPDGHLNLVKTIYQQIGDPDSRLQDDWLSGRIKALDNISGDIEDLQQRLTNIRVWTYVANRQDWVAKARYWRERTIAVENKLSDALHDRLTQRFVDRRTSVLLKSLYNGQTGHVDLLPRGELKIDKVSVGYLKGLRFNPHSKSQTLEGRAIRHAARNALQPIINAKLQQIVTSPNAAFRLEQDNKVYFEDAPIAKLLAGHEWYKPKLKMLDSQIGSPAMFRATQERLEAWLTDIIDQTVPLVKDLQGYLDSADSKLNGQARAIAYRLIESGLSIDLRNEARIEATARERLKAFGVRLGRISAYSPKLLKPSTQTLILQLKTLHMGIPFAQLPLTFASFVTEKVHQVTLLNAMGYLKMGQRAVRVDLAERLAWRISKARREAGRAIFAVESNLACEIGCPREDFIKLLPYFGLKAVNANPQSGEKTHTRLWRYARTKPKAVKPILSPKNQHSAFDALANWKYIQEDGKRGKKWGKRFE